MTDATQPPPPRDRAARAALWLLAGLAVLWTAFFARPILVPIVFAVVLKFLLSPIVRGLRRVGVPAVVTALALVLGGLGAGAAAIVTMAPTAVHWTEELPARLHRLEGKLMTLREPVAAITAATSEVGEKVDDLAAVTKPVPDEPTTVVRIEEPSWIETAFEGLSQLAVELFLTAAMLFLLLLGDGVVASKLAATGTPAAHRWLEGLYAIEQRTGLYVRSMLLVHGCVGLVFALFCWSWGMPSPWLWGVVVAFCNAVPFLGPLVVTGVLTVVTLTTFDTVGTAIVPPLAYVLLHLVETNLVTPCLLGRWLSLSPVAIFVALAVMGFLWGAPGLVLAVPLLVIARITSDYVPHVRPLQLLLDGRPGIAPSTAPVSSPTAAHLPPAIPATHGAP